MKLIYVTERRRIQGDAHDYLSRLLSGRPDALLIREKDLSPEELIRFAAPLVPIAERRGATTVTYGHIFTSPCKPGLPPRGTAALDEIVRACTIPVYAIGGITADTLPFLLPIHPAAACLMSASMTDPEPETLTTRLRRILERA